MKRPAQRVFRSSAVLVSLAVAPCLLFGQTTITVLHVNDTHSHLEAFGPKQGDLTGTIGGLAKAATVVSRIRQADPNTLFLHAGDAAHGDLYFNRYFGVPELQLLRQLGLDAMAVGNHEFDFGSGFLSMVLASAGPMPLLSANLTIPEGHPLAGAIAPHLTKDVGGVKVGIFGLTTPNDPVANPAPLVLRKDVAVVAAAEVAALRGEGATVVIALSHLGLTADEALAASVSGIDFIVGGHDHYALKKAVTVTAPDGAPVRIVQAGEFYEHVGILRFTVNDGKIRFRGARLIPVDQHVPPAPQVQAVVDSLKPGMIARYGDVFGAVIAEAGANVSKSFDPQSPKRDTPMGNLVTDALRARTGSQVAVTVTGLVSEGLYAGPLAGADVFRPVSYGYDPVSGYGFKIATVDILGAELIKAIETCLSFSGASTTFDVQVSGMSFRYDSRRPAGQRLLLETVSIQARPIDPTAVYSMTVNEGIAKLLPSLGVRVEGVTIWPDLEYVVLRDFVVSLGTVSYASEGRIRDIAACHRRRRARAASIPREHASIEALTPLR